MPPPQNASPSAASTAPGSSAPPSRPSCRPTSWRSSPPTWSMSPSRAARPSASASAASRSAPTFLSVSRPWRRRRRATSRPSRARRARAGLVQTIPGQAATRLILPDLPLLRDVDDTAGTGSRLYYLMAGYGAPGWPGAALYRSAEGTSWSQVGRALGEAAWGAAANALGSPRSPFATDEANTLTVFMTTGGERLESTTQEAMLNGANAALLLKSQWRARDPPVPRRHPQPRRLLFSLGAPAGSAGHRRLRRRPCRRASFSSFSIRTTSRR